MPPGTRGTCASMHVGITPHLLRSAFLLRLKARGMPSLVRPLAGAKTHWVFAHLRLTQVLRPSGVQISSKLGHPCLAKTSSPAHPCTRRSAGYWFTGPIAFPPHPGDFVKPRTRVSHPPIPNQLKKGQTGPFPQLIWRRGWDYSAHPCAPPFGPAFGRSNLVPTNLSNPGFSSHRTTKDLLEGVHLTPSRRSGGEGGIRTHVGRLCPQPISSRCRYDHFGTSPLKL